MNQPNITGHTKLIGLLGHPVDHSMSPAMHTASYAHMGEDIVYLSFDVEPEGLEAAVEGMKIMGFVGANVTMPCKTFVGQYLDELTPAAELMGAVNTVAIRDGKAIGHNTDGAGFVKNLENNGVAIEGAHVTLIGCGGAGSAIMTQLALDKVAHIDVFNAKDQFWNATMARVATVAEKTNTPIDLHDLADLEDMKSCALKSTILINATPVGMAPNTEGCIPTEDMLHEGLAVGDTVYNPRETKLIKMAKDKGLVACGGLGMLLQQAALGEEFWTGSKMDTKFIEDSFYN
ncbi:MAG: shikimate dehydrogenase [Coriobacteriia bacterium]|nr:shikimate dehydrogenase [Coriobacteriia bacterium]